jgi:anti-sigma-K factor RskA
MTDADRPDEVVAGEYVLGVLEDAERATFEHRLARDRALQSLVARWQERLLPLDTTAAPATPPAGLWGQIEASVGRRGAVNEKPSLAARLWLSLGFWRGTSFAGAAASLALAVALVLMAGRSTPQPLYVAVLQAGDASPGAIVEISYDGILVVPLKDFEVPSGRTLQVWTLWDQARGPVSVGLFARPQRTYFQRADLPARDSQLYEITLEPAGGSPTGRPTGPVLGKGYAAIPR